MSHLIDVPARRRGLVATLIILTAIAVLLISGAFSSSRASAAQPSVNLGTAASFAVLAGSTVTNTGPSVISGDLGVSPGSAVTGFPPGSVSGGTQHKADAVALQAQSDLTTAYNDAAGRTPATAAPADIGGQTLVSGVYNDAAGMALTGTVTLNAQGDPNAVFIFQAGSTLITASNSTVGLINGAQACNVFWQVGSSATLGTGTNFVGNILALTSISAQTDANVTGRLLARNGAVTLDTNTITRPGCTIGTTSTPTPTPSVTTSPTKSASPTASPTSTSTKSPTSTPSVSSTSTGVGGGGPTSSPSRPTSSPGGTGSAGPGPGRTPKPSRAPTPGGTITTTPRPTHSPTPVGHGPGSHSPVVSSTSTSIPRGGPQTGVGGAAASGNADGSALIAGGAVSLLGAGAASSQAIRRRRRLTGSQ